MAFAHLFRPGMTETTDSVNPIAVTGSVAFVSVDIATVGRRDRLLGGSAAHFALGARLFAPVAITAVVGRDFSHDDLACLDRRGISTLGMQMTDGLTSSWTAVYEDELSDAQTLNRRLAPAVPRRSLRAPGHGVEQLDVCFESPATLRAQHGARPCGRFVALDEAHSLGESPPVAVVESLSAARGVFLSSADARVLTGESQFVAAGRRLRRLGPELIVLTHGQFGASLFAEDLYCKVPAFPTADVVDPTGAGAAFAGGFLGTIAALGAELDEGALRLALLWATVVASFAVEGFGVQRSLAVTSEELCERFDRFEPMLRLDGGWR